MEALTPPLPHAAQAGAVQTHYDAEGEALLLQWTCPQLELTSPGVVASRLDRLSLVVAAGALQPRNTYTFQLQATEAGWVGAWVLGSWLVVCGCNNSIFLT